MVRKSDFAPALRIEAVMSIRHKLLFFLLGVGLFSVTLFDYHEWRAAKRDMVAMAQLPAPVKAAIEHEAQGGTLKKTKMTTAERKIAYTARIAVNGNDQETIFGEDGKVISRAAFEENDDDD
jgi:hypothetical protein